MVIRWDEGETEMTMDSYGRAKAFETLMSYSRLERPSFDGLAKSVGKSKAALCYSFLLVDTIRFLSALRYGLGHTDEYPSGKTLDTIWRPEEVRTALEHEFRRPMPVLVTSGLS